MTFVPAVLLFLFAAAFFAVWAMEHARKHLLLFSLAFLSFGAATFSQLALWPSDIGYNTMVSAVLYVGGTLLFAEGVLARSDKHLSPLFHAASFALVVGAAWYFYYIDRSLLARVYILNFGIGGIFLCAAWKARFLSRGSGIDRALFWLLLALAIHFFPRTLLTAGSVPDGGVAAFAQSEFWMWLQFSLSILAVVVGLGLLAVASADVIADLRKERDNDPLTGLLNRRGLESRAERLLAKHGWKKICILICDIDHFKRINDTFGHSTGDIVLAGFARIAMKTVRSGDLVGRIGGEEFVVILKDCPVPQAFKLAERLRAEMERAHFEGLAPAQSVTCSFGIAEFHAGESLWDAIGRADKILYAAKRAGRNRTYAEGIQLPSAA